jgi:hypothetical protein
MEPWLSSRSTPAIREMGADASSIKAKSFGAVLQQVGDPSFLERQGIAEFGHSLLSPVLSIDSEKIPR